MHIYNGFHHIYKSESNQTLESEFGSKNSGVVAVLWGSISGIPINDRVYMLKTNKLE